MWSHNASRLRWKPCTRCGKRYSPETGEKKNSNVGIVMNSFSGNAISWASKDGAIELALHREPCNELGTQSLAEFEKFIAALPALEEHAHALVIYSQLDSGFSAGADLRETYYRTQHLEKEAAVASVRESLERTHHVMNTLDRSPLTTIAAVHGVTFGGGLKLALSCDL